MVIGITQMPFWMRPYSFLFYILLTIVQTSTPLKCILWFESLQFVMSLKVTIIVLARGCSAHTLVKLAGNRVGDIA